jgi:hypothetical protein
VVAVQRLLGDAKLDGCCLGRITPCVSPQDAGWPPVEQLPRTASCSWRPAGFQPEGYRVSCLVPDPQVSNTASESPTPQRARDPRRVIHASCSVHQGAAGFTNLVVSKRGGEIELDPHADGGCLLTLRENEACALRDALTEWLG